MGTMMTSPILLTGDVPVSLPYPHKHQRRFIRSKAKRRIIRAGRRGGKTVGVAALATLAFLEGRRVLYGAPTTDQVDTFWRNVKRNLKDALDRKPAIFHKNEGEHFIELPGTEQRIKAKTCWNADTLRGDYADLLILDEYQLMDEDTWGVVGAPMLLDNNGDAVFIYTPPSIRFAGVSKAKDKRHAAKLFKRAQADTSGRWEAFTFTSHQNPYLSKEALAEVSSDMTKLSYRQEILAEDIDEIPGALWTRKTLEEGRRQGHPPLKRIVIGVDPKTSAEATSETGIIAAGIDYNNEGWLLGDFSIDGSPEEWGRRVVACYYEYEADRIVPEVNQGGDMVSAVIRMVDPTVPIRPVHASRGKATRAEPIAALYEQGRIHHVGEYLELEDQLTSWTQGDASPDRLDALVWAFTELMVKARPNRKAGSFQG